MVALRMGLLLLSTSSLGLAAIEKKTGILFAGLPLPRLPPPRLPEALSQGYAAATEAEAAEGVAVPLRAPQPTEAQVVSPPLPVGGLVGLAANNNSPRVLRTACDKNPSITYAEIERIDSIVRPAGCLNALSNSLAVQTVVQNPEGDDFSIYHGMTTAQCNTNSPSTVITSSSAKVTGSGYAAMLRTPCTSNTNCCVLLVCENRNKDCTNLNVSVSYIPTSLSGCGGTDLGLAYIPKGSVSNAIGCVYSSTPPSGSTQDFVLSNVRCAHFFSSLVSPLFSSPRGLRLGFGSFLHTVIIKSPHPDPSSLPLLRQIAQRK
jgi:hypothetical protein